MPNSDTLSALLGEGTPFRDAFDAYCVDRARSLAALDPSALDEYAQIARLKLDIPVIADADGPDAALPAFLADFAQDCDRERVTR